MYGQYQQQKVSEAAAKQSAEYNAQVAAADQASQTQLAQNEIAKGAAERNRHMRGGARQMGEMRSQLAASGFEMDSGSGLSLLGESAEEIQYDANIIDQNTNMSAWQYQVGAANAANNQSWANYQKSQAGSGRTSTLIGMGGTLLGGLGQGLGQYNAWQSTKTPKFDLAGYTVNNAFKPAYGIKG
ncbi:hypothetical protein C4J81_17125 [Deltaproteobacteria bacterium Smac51]|nr:hypothetical protein C4J81_17125 [Deltaproteobacteria bacterium Smac51]